MENKTYYYSIDIMKYICAVMVLCIHLCPHQYLRELWCGAICRGAVPLFFTASAFLFFGIEKEENRFVKYAKRILTLYAIYTFIYWLVFRNGIWGGNIRNVIKKILFTSISDHLWYFVGVLVSIGLVILLSKKFNNMVLLVISLLLYFLGTLISTYFSIISSNHVLNKVVNCYMDIFATARNGVFMGMVFVTIGKIFRENVEKAQRKKWRYWIIILSVSLILVCVERLFVGKFTQNTFGRDMLIVLPILAYSSFGFVLKINKVLSERKSNLFHNSCIYLRNISTIFYAIHVIFIYTISIQNRMLKWGVVWAVSMFISLLIVWMSRNIKRLWWLKYFY